MSYNEPSSFVPQKQLAVAANRITETATRTFSLTRNASFGKTFKKKLERRTDSSKNASEWDVAPDVSPPLRRLRMPRERLPVLLKLIGRPIGPPTSRRSSAPIRRLSFFNSAPHWTTWTDDELILVKYSCARDELKIGRYIKRVAEGRQAPLLLCSAVTAAAAPPPPRG